MEGSDVPPIPGSMQAEAVDPGLPPGPGGLPHPLCPHLQPNWDLGLPHSSSDTETLLLFTTLQASHWIQDVGVLLGLCQQSMLGIVFPGSGALSPRAFRRMRGRSSNQFGNTGWETCLLAAPVGEWPQGSMGMKEQGVPSRYSIKPPWVW